MPRPLGSDRPYVTRAHALPRRLDAVTPQWLTGLLAPKFPGIVVRDFETVECKSSHTTKLRLRLHLNDVGVAAGIAEHVCLKANWSGMRTGQIAEREARFYHLISSGLDCPVPLSYFADWDDDGSGQGVVVMEDLGRSPGAFGLSDDHLGIDAVATGLETLARVHAAMWDDPRLDSYEWLPHSMGTANDTEQVIEYWHYIRFNLTDPAYQSVVPPWVYERPELMNQVLDELSAYEHDLAGPRCLVHGDAHQGNSFLRADGQRVWVDWQLVRRGTPWRDVSYFILSCLTVEERRRADRDLVEHYRQHLMALGAQGVVDAESAWQQFMRWPGYGTQAWLGNINLWGQRNGAEMVKRHFAASEDYDTVGLLTKGKLPGRQFVGGEGAYRLPQQLQEIQDARAGT
jgi:hypothetical protein